MWLWSAWAPNRATKGAEPPGPGQDFVGRLDRPRARGPSGHLVQRRAGQLGVRCDRHFDVHAAHAITPTASGTASSVPWESHMPTAAGLRRTVAWTCRALLSLRWPEDPPRTQLSLEGAPGCLVAATWAGAQGWRLEALSEVPALRCSAIGLGGGKRAGAALGSESAAPGQPARRLRGRRAVRTR